MRKIEDVIRDQVIRNKSEYGHMQLLSDELIKQLANALLAEWPELDWECREIEGGQVIALFPIHDFDGDYHICLNCGAKRSDV